MTTTILENSKANTLTDSWDPFSGGRWLEEDIPEHVRKDIEEGEQQLDAGLGIPHEAAMERLRQGFVVFDNLPDEAKKGIEEGLKDIAAGRIHTHEEVEKELFG